MPSSASGVGLPSDIVEPVWLNVTYLKPAGSASTSTPRWSATRRSGPYGSAPGGRPCPKASRATSRSIAPMLSRPPPAAAARVRNVRLSIVVMLLSSRSHCTLHPFTNGPRSGLSVARVTDIRPGGFSRTPEAEQRGVRITFAIGSLVAALALPASASAQDIIVKRVPGLTASSAWTSARTPASRSTRR